MGRLGQLQSVSPYVLLNASREALDGAAVVIAWTHMTTSLAVAADFLAAVD